MLSLEWTYNQVTLQVIIHGTVSSSTDPKEVIAFDDLSFSSGCVSTRGNKHPHDPNIIIIT